MIKNLLSLSLITLPLFSHAQIFQENWDGSGPGLSAWTIIDGDGNTVDSNISSLFPTAWSLLSNTNISTLTSNAAASTSWYNPIGTSNDWLISPSITLTGTSPTLYWNAKAQDPSYKDGYKVMLSPTGGTAMSDFTMELFSIGAENSNWTYRYVDLTSYIGQTVRFAFVNNSSDKYILLVDDIKIEPTFIAPPISYCGPLAFAWDFLGFSMDGDEPITRVTFADLVNTSSTDAYVGNSHEFFLNQTANVTAGQTYNMTVEGDTGRAYQNHIVAFIDWNQNGILNDPGEVYPFADALYNSNGQDGIMVTTSITVPTNALPGTTRMRIKKSYEPINPLDPCEGGDYGQAEDYTVNVTNILTTNEIQLIKNPIKLYPNPAADMVTLQTPYKIKEVTLYDAAGKKLNIQLNTNNNTIDLKGVPTGNYILNVETEHHVQSLKLLKK